MEYWKGFFKLSEECGELIQALGKVGAYPVAPHPDGKGDAASRLNDEVADVYASLDYFVTENHERLNLDYINERRAKKRAQFREWGLNGIIKDGDS